LNNKLLLCYAADTLNKSVEEINKSLVLHCQTIRTIPLKRTQHKTVDYLEENEMQALLNAVEINSRSGVRHNALLLLLYNLQWLNAFSRAPQLCVVNN